MRFRFVFVFLLGVFLFSSCSLERRLAMEFMKQKESKVAVLVVPPFSLEMYNSNEYNFDSINIPEGFPMDSLLFQQTKLLKHISDSVFLENYLNGFIYRLREFGFRVFLPDELGAFKEVETPAYIFKFAQVELSEEYYPYEVSEKVSDTDFYKIFYLELVTANSWFEFEAQDTTWHKVFFAEDAVMDEFSSEVVLDDLSGNPVLYYSVDSLSVKEVYQMATDLGNKYAGYFTDYLMNSYIDQKFPKDKKAEINFHYDADLKMLFHFEEGFQEITKEK